MNNTYFAVEIYDKGTGRTKLIKVPKVGAEIIEYFQDNGYIDEMYTISMAEMHNYFAEEFEIENN